LSRPDRFGIAYRPELAASLYAYAHELDRIELMADDWFGASSRELRALTTLSRRVPVQLHAVGLGLASTSPVDGARLRALARVVEACGGAPWSEHLAFVRAGGIELNQLCAPPRTEATLEGLARNIQRAARVTCSLPALENVASLIDPPGSQLDEASFVARALALTGAPLLLDLHNLHANALNFGLDPDAFLDALPLERVRTVHLAGGKRVRVGDVERVLDDHRHAVPQAVYALLEELAARTSQPLDVIVERDGPVPPWAAYVGELRRARAAVARGRTRASRGLSSGQPATAPASDRTQEERAAHAQAVEAWLARLYSDAALRARFLASPDQTLAAVPLEPNDKARLLQIDRAGLELHARSLVHKSFKCAARP